MTPGLLLSLTAKGIGKGLEVDVTSCQGHHAFRFEKGFHNHSLTCSLQPRWEGSHSIKEESEAQRREVTHQRIPRRLFPWQCCLSRLGPEAGDLGFSVRGRSAQRVSHGSPSSLWIPCPRSREEGVDFSRKSLQAGLQSALLGCGSDFWFQAVRAPLRALLICRMEESPHQVAIRAEGETGSENPLEAGPGTNWGGYRGPLL